ncbi:MAG TPA: hypothetical protein VL282_15980, partial [Tepidisphaeraceae bacterium]|nr:hypothetical protein [Tepidisphaeraceae bacterium]
MDRNHVYRAALAIGLTLFGGCQAHKKSQTNPSASAVESAPASAEKISLDTEGNSATQPDNVDALTRKAEAYAKAMVQMQQTKHASTSTSALSRGDEVRWLDQPDQLSLSNMPPNAKKLEIAMAPEVLVKPVIESTPTVANAPTAAVPKASATAGPIPTQVALIDASKAPLAPAPSPAAVTSGPQNNSALDERLGRLVKDYPKDVSAQFEYQLLQFLENQQVPQMQVLSSLPSEDRELLTAIVDGLSNFRNTIRIDNNMLLSRKVRPILDLAERLRSQAELSIPTLALCSKVSGFGNYEPVEARFPAGKETKVV